MPSKAIRWPAHLAFALIGCAAVWGIYTMMKPADEVVLTMGEPYEQVRKQSRSTLTAVEPGANWAGVIDRPARLRFVDPQFGFSTPAAKFMMVSYDEHGRISGVTMSPQIETLPLDQTMMVVTDLQAQLRRGGWHETLVTDHPPITDSPTVRARIRECAAPTGYWQAGDKYQISVNVRCFRSDDQPNDERFLITVDVARPWLDDNPS